MSEIRVTHLPEVYRDDDLFAAAAARGVLAGLEAAGEFGRSQTVEAIMASEPRPPVDTGLMRLGQVWELDPHRFSVRIGPEVAVLARTVAMEHGRKPGAKRPPVTPILGWIHRKGLASGFLMGRRRQEVLNRRADLGKGKSGKKLSLSKAAVTRETEIELAFQIARSIARKGIKARRFYARAIPKIRARAGAIVSHHVLDSIRRAITGAA